MGARWGHDGAKSGPAQPRSMLEPTQGEALPSFLRTDLLPRPWPERRSARPCRGPNTGGPRAKGLRAQLVTFACCCMR
eukprot:287635-Alexandrium_andersonii.AAC.1